MVFGTASLCASGDEYFFRKFVLHAEGGVVSPRDPFFHAAFNLYNEIKGCSDGAEANMIWTARPILADQEKYLRALKVFDHFCSCYREKFAVIEAEIEAMIDFLRALAKFGVLTRLHNLIEDPVLQKTLRPFSVWLDLLLSGIPPDHEEMQTYENKFSRPLRGYSPEAIDAYIRHYEIEHRGAV